MGNGQNSPQETVCLVDSHVFDKPYSWKTAYLKKKFGNSKFWKPFHYQQTGTKPPPVLGHIV